VVGGLISKNPLSHTSTTTSVRPLFFYTPISVNSHPACEMRRDCALPGTVSVQDPSVLSTTERRYYGMRAENEPDDASETINLENLIRMSDGSAYGSEASVNCIPYLQC
jgi:hypothetical protein